MNRKWNISLIIVAVLVFLLILAWLVASMWQKLSISGVCIQGRLPYIWSTPSLDQSLIFTPVLLPTNGAGGPIPIIVDDDGSPDGMVALLYFLRNPLFDVRAVTISYGEAHPEKFAPLLANALASLGGAENIPIGYGRDAPLEGSNAFPDTWRDGSDDFWGHPELNNSIKTFPAAQLIVTTVKNSPQPVLLFISGSHTNLAEALSLDPSVAGNIRAIYIMGGAVNVPGNIHSEWPAIENEVAEWNIWVDPLAFQQVLGSKLDLHLIPLDATQHVTWTREDLAGWGSSRSAEGDLAASLLEWMLNNASAGKIYIWDLVAAVQATGMDVCPEVQMSLEVSTLTGPEQGRIKPYESAPNISVCLDPDTELVKAIVQNIFGQP